VPFLTSCPAYSAHFLTTGGAPFLTTGGIVEIVGAVDVVLPVVAAPVLDVAGTNPNVTRPVGDPWLDRRDISDH
jgi:hypothetical protein